VVCESVDRASGGGALREGLGVVAPRVDAEGVRGEEARVGRRVEEALLQQGGWVRVCAGGQNGSG